jgi:hypothetical protein
MEPSKETAVATETSRHLQLTNVYTSILWATALSKNQTTRDAADIVLRAVRFVPPEERGATGDLVQANEIMHARHLFLVAVGNGLRG